MALHPILLAFLSAALFGAATPASKGLMSDMDNTLLLEALEPYDFSGIAHLCDVGGGHGHTLCHLLLKYPHLKGTVVELPSVIEDRELLWADKMGVGERCAYQQTWYPPSKMLGIVEGVKA